MGKIVEFRINAVYNYTAIKWETVVAICTELLVILLIHQGNRTIRAV